MRVDEDQRWMPFYLAQPVWNFINACLFHPPTWSVTYGRIRSSCVDTRREPM